MKRPLHCFTNPLLGLTEIFTTIVSAESSVFSTTILRNNWTSIELTTTTVAATPTTDSPDKRSEPSQVLDVARDHCSCGSDASTTSITFIKTQTEPSSVVSLVTKYVATVIPSPIVVLKTAYNESIAVATITSVTGGVITSSYVMCLEFRPEDEQIYPGRKCDGQLIRRFADTIQL